MTEPPLIPRDVRDVYTTQQIATLFGVCRQTVARWVDSGRLKARRRGSCQRRQIDHAALVTFVAREMPEMLVRVTAKGGGA